MTYTTKKQFYGGLKMRGIFAVISGFFLTFLLSRGTDIFLESTGVFPPVADQLKNGFNVMWMNMVALTYRALFAACGGYLTAVIATSRPMRQVHILAAISTAIAIVANVALAFSPTMANVLPVWFSVAMVITAYPSTLLGRWIYLRKP